MQTIPLDQAEGRLVEIVARLRPDEEIVLTRDDKPIATIRAAPAAPREPPRFGTLRGSILYIAPDFDAIPEGFEDYLP
jgi:antitoxin (DNA-binding transcriptional repressor) of toxin-antitoxin stability system